jgi:hypothetical protein
MSYSKPSVFLSSTCYDLGQLRVDLGTFIERDLGYTAMMSEHPSFPIDPDTTTIENCRRRVDQDADVLVLVVGARHGTVDPATSRSITNIEYVTAKAKGIPVYAFVHKPVLAALPLWRGLLEQTLVSHPDRHDES